MDRSKIDAAVVTIRTSRQTHVEWRDHFDANPSVDPGHLGDANYHRKVVEEYNNVLEVLSWLRES